MFFRSDNGAPVTPEVMAALIHANGESAVRPYGNDELSTVVRDQIRTLFEAPEAEVEFVLTGTAANSLALATMAKPWSTIFCHEQAHIYDSESGAPEFFTSGAKLVPLPGAHGKIDPQAFAPRLETWAETGVGTLALGALSLTNLTEAGTSYSPEEIKALTTQARAYGLPVHMDGARFANAIAGKAITPAEMTWRAGVDVLSFGGTKNGCMGVEAVVYFAPALIEEFHMRRKRAGHTLSKGRYLAAQFAGYLQDGLWLERAAHANQMAQLMADGFAAKGITCAHPVDGNILMPAFPIGTHARLTAADARYYERPLIKGLVPQEAARIVTSWNTTPEEIDRFIALL